MASRQQAKCVEETGPTLVRWLSQCFREDRTRFGVIDFFNTKVQLRRFQKGEENILNGLFEGEHVAGSYGANILEKSVLYQREKEVVYGSFFVCGKNDGVTVRSPLVLYEVEASPSLEATLLTVRLERWRLNWGLIDLLDGSGELAIRLADFFASHRFLSDGVVGELRALLQEVESIESSDGLLSWPYLEKSGDLRESASREGLRVYAGSAFAMLDRSRSSRGVIDELRGLAEVAEEEYSAALRRVLLPCSSEEKHSGSICGEEAVVPLVLSEAQERVVQAARTQPLSVCYGPPGTGKSLTIAAIALDHVSRGESVLVVSKMNHAVDVVMQKINQLAGFENLTVRGGRSSYLSEMKDYLDDCLRGVVTLGSCSLEQAQAAEKDLRESIRVSRSLEETLERELSKAESRGMLRCRSDKSFVDTLKVLIGGVSVGFRNLLSELVESLHQWDTSLDKLVRRYIQQAHDARLAVLLEEPSNRKQLKRFSDAIRKRKSADQQALFEQLDMSLLIRTLPVWLVNMDDMHQVLPLQKELFDVVVVDESSQCDLASVLPALYRAKRVVVAGDPKQLRHVSFVSNLSMQSYARELGLSEHLIESFHYRRMSLMDVALDKDLDSSQVNFLNEHFRSVACLIRFSSERFYRGQLSLMRDRCWEAAGLGLRLVACMGKRDEHGVNGEEAEAVVRRLHAILEEDAGLEEGAVRSVGVLSPMRKQVDAIAKLVRERFDRSQVKRLLEVHQLMVATPHGFQGEERDHMLLSFALGAGEAKGALRYVEQEDVFNVSVTRAKNIQEVFYSVQPAEMASPSLLADYLSQTKVTRRASQASYSDSFFREVSGVLEQAGWRVRQQKSVSGVSVDIVAEKDGEVIGFDLIGHVGEMCGAVRLKRLRLLHRAGFKVYPIGFTEWVKRRSEVTKWIHELGR